MEGWGAPRPVMLRALALSNEPINFINL
jgi:hypothetical protein